MTNKIVIYVILYKKPYIIDKSILYGFYNFILFNVIRQQFILIYDSKTKYSHSTSGDIVPSP